MTDVYEIVKKAITERNVLVQEVAKLGQRNAELALQVEEAHKQIEFMDKDMDEMSLLLMQESDYSKTLRKELTKRTEELAKKEKVIRNLDSYLGDYLSYLEDKCGPISAPPEVEDEEIGF